MAKNYKKMYAQLRKHCQALYEHMLDLDGDNQTMGTELKYYADYISWKNLNEEFLYFKEKAYEIHDGNSPFPTLRL